MVRRMRTPFGDLPGRWVEHGSMSEQHDFLQARVSRRTLLKGAAVAGVAATGPALWVPPARATVLPPVTRYVGFGADPQREAVVSFATAGPFQKALVEYGTDDTFEMSAAVDLRTVPGVQTVYGHSPLQGLEPGTRYRYRVRLDDAVSEAATLTTAPSEPQPFTFTAFGDQGTSRPARSVVQQLVALRPTFNLLVGDLCYADTSGPEGSEDDFDPTVWDSWLSMIEPVAATSAWMCTTGNHDMEPGYGPLGYSGYLERFLVPANGASACPSTYTFRYGNVAFVSLDSNDLSYEFPQNFGYSQGAQTSWLDQQFAGLRAPDSGIDFIVVFFHHCAFSTSVRRGSEAAVREHWVPLLDKYEVDLVINGHAHLYERTSLIRHGQITSVAPHSSRVD